MPTYEYECFSCSKRFDVVQSMKDDPITVCPECKGKVRRIIGGGLGVIFKGSGFYSTDNKRSSVTTGETGKSDTGKSDTGKSDTGKSTDTKTEKSPPDTKPTKDEKKSA